MLFRRILAREHNKVNGGAALAVGIFFAVFFLIVLFMVGTPRGLLFAASHRVQALPSWLFLLVCLFFYFACGLSLGCVLFQKGGAWEVPKYRGAFFFCIGIAASYLWYAVTFGARFFFLALLLSAFSTVFLALSALNFRRAFCASFWGMAVSVLWQIYLTVFTVLLFFFL